MYEERSTLYKDWQTLARNVAALPQKKSSFSPKLLDDLEVLLRHIMFFLEESETSEKTPMRLQETNAVLAYLQESIPLYFSGREVSNVLRSIQVVRDDLPRFVLKRKKILVLYATLGNGHSTAAEAIFQGFQYYYGKDYDIELIDFLQTASKFMNTTYKAAYDLSTRIIPALYKWFFEYTDTTWRVKLINYLSSPLLINKTEEMIDQKKPDIIISTFPIWDFTIKNVWSKYSKQNKYISIVTDSIRVQKAWVTADVDCYIVSNKDTAETLHGYGIPDEKIKPLGFPLRLSFYQSLDKGAIMKRYGLDPKKKTILYSIGTGGKKGDLTSLIYLDKHLDSHKVQIVDIFGRNKLLKEKLEKGKRRLSHIILGWTEEMHALMAISDVMVTKAGGAIVMECIQKKLPMVISRVIPGQEEGNVALIQKYGIGKVALRDKALLQAVIYYLSLPKKTIVGLFQRVHTNNAIKVIVEFISHFLLNGKK